MSPRMVPLTVCARREYIAASTRLAHITTRNMFLPTDVFSILFCRSGVIGLLWTNATLVTHGLSHHNQERGTAFWLQARPIMPIRDTRNRILPVMGARIVNNCGTNCQ